MQRPLMVLFKAFGTKPDEDMVAAYAVALCDIEPAKLQGAVVAAIRECEFMPRPVEIRKLAGVHAASEDRAVAAWGDVLRAVPLGPYKSIDFADSRINATLRLLGGWSAAVARFSSVEDEKWFRMEFLKTYQSIGGCISDEQKRPLMGLSEKQVVRGQIVDPVPVRIGCDRFRKTGIEHRGQQSIGVSQ